MLRRLSLRWLIPLTLVVLLLATCGGSADDSVDTTVASTATSSEAPPVGDPEVKEWVQVPYSGGLVGSDGSQEMNGVTSWEGGFVAVGADGSDIGRNAAVWVSADGLEWSRVVDPDGLDNDGWQSMNAVVAGGRGFVAVGTSAPGLHKDDAAVWTSVDGQHWSRVADDSGVFTGSGDHQMLDVVVHRPFHDPGSCRDALACADASSPLRASPRSRSARKSGRKTRAYPHVPHSLDESRQDLYQVRRPSA